ncbi:MAG: fatty acid desaturase [Candidatus Methylacidiphilales bacterium]
MNSSLLKQEPHLKEFTEDVRRNVSINWYRTKLPPGALKQLHEKSDWQASVQTLGYLAMLAIPGAGAWYSFNYGTWWLTAACLFIYGMVASFLINAVHELGHGTVFRTKWLNDFFCHVFAFLGWINHELFQSSHIRHHRYTLHPPDDLEVVLPVRLIVWNALRHGIVNAGAFKGHIQNTLRIARGRFQGDWELTLYPENDKASRVVPVRWARAMLLGHGIIAMISISYGQWIIPIIISGSGIFGGWLNFLCNNTQHVGLQDNAADFRLCCRTFTLHPFVRFVYWQMNYHIEHHMYAAVPCYNLGKLHEMIRHDLPPTPHGLIAVWQEIIAILKRQEQEPGYQHIPQLPGGCKETATEATEQDGETVAA